MENLYHIIGKCQDSISESKIQKNDHKSIKLPDIRNNLSTKHSSPEDQSAFQKTRLKNKNFQNYVLPNIGAQNNICLRKSISLQDIFKEKTLLQSSNAKTPFNTEETNETFPDEALGSEDTFEYRNNNQEESEYRNSIFDYENEEEKMSFLDISELRINNYNFRGEIKPSPASATNSDSRNNSKTYDEIMKKIKLFSKNCATQPYTTQRNHISPMLDHSLMTTRRNENSRNRNYEESKVYTRTIQHHTRAVSVAPRANNQYVVKSKRNCGVCIRDFSPRNNKIQNKAILNPNYNKLYQIYGESRLESLFENVHCNPWKRGKERVYSAILELRKLHYFFSKISLQATKEMFSEVFLTKIKKNQILYKEGYCDSSAFIVLYGKLILKRKNFGAIGVVKMGNTVGEEAVVANYSKRLETVIADQNICLMEFSIENLQSLKTILFGMGLKGDFILLQSLFRKNFNQKKAWRKNV